MRALHHKLWRDLAYLKTQALAIALVIACGVATFVMSVSVLRSLEQSRDRYYERYRFAHVFAHLKRAPEALAERFAEIPGVAAVQIRVVAEVTLDLPDMPEPAVGRLVSIPDFAEPALNGLHLRRGRWPEPGERGEVLANEAFAAAHGFVPGDRFTAILNGRREQLTIVGIALSPEYVYQIRAGDLLPDDRRFGVLWMREEPLAAAFDLTDAFNDVALTLMRGASEPGVIQQLDTLTEPYGGLGAYGRSDQVSHRYVSDELSQLRGMALVPPSIFLLVAAFILNVVLNRVIATQREQVATLKAFGYTRRELGAHYLQLTLLIIFSGAALGIAAGGWLGRGLAELYMQFFRFPELEFTLEPSVLVLATAISVVSGGIGVITAIARVVRLPPAEAMRPEAPGVFRPTLLERLGLQESLAQTSRMVLRQIERRPMRAAISVGGIAMAIAVMILGSFSKDIIDYVVAFQFGGVQRYDFTIGFFEPTRHAALHGAAQLPGVQRAEPFRSVAVRMIHGHRSRRLGVMGLPADRDLLRPLDAEERTVVVPPEGLLLSEKLAELLGVHRGETVRLEVLEGKRRTGDVVVAQTLRDFSGLTAYMDLDALNRFLLEGPVISGAFLKTDAAHPDELYRHIKETPRIGSVVSQKAAFRSFEETMAENLLRMRFFNVMFASIIAFGVVYNAARITLSERAHELATLRVIGLTRGEVSAILIGEIAVLTLLAAPLGVVFGHALAAFAVEGLQTETQRFPFVIAPATYAMAVSTVFVAAAVSCLIVRRRIDAFDLVSVLKSRD